MKNHLSRTLVAPLLCLLAAVARAQSPELRALVPRIPAGRLMIETDAPYLLPRDLSPKPKSRRNEPAFLAHIAATIADLRGEPVEQLLRHTRATSRAFFRLDEVTP